MARNQLGNKDGYLLRFAEQSYLFLLASFRGSKFHIVEWVRPQEKDWLNDVRDPCHPGMPAWGSPLP